MATTGSWRRTLSARRSPRWRRGGSTSRSGGGAAPPRGARPGGGGGGAAALWGGGVPPRGGGGAAARGFGPAGPAPADAAHQPAHHGVLLLQPRQAVAELGQLDLQLGVAAA